MATQLASASIKTSLAALFQNLLDIGTAEYKPQVNWQFDFTDGAGANQAQKVFTDTRTLTASSTEDLDLAGGLTDAFGNVLTLTEVKAIIIKAAAGNTNNVIVGGAASNQFVTPFGAGAHTVTVRPGGMLMLVAPDATGYAVTAGTGDLLKIANSAGSTSVTYDILILGN